MASDSTGGKAQSEGLRELEPEQLFIRLKQITNDFSNDRRIGDGDQLGIVYKGILEDGGVIAVHRFEKNSPLGCYKNFDDKVHLFMALKHENIVKMVAFCLHKVGDRDGAYVERVLCYEHLRKGSLHENLFAKPISIDWNTRFKIIEGICQGLLFLHKLDVPIIHMDLKPQNIFLDDNMVPKIANFILSKLYGKEQIGVREKTVAGSYGYMAPEYAHTGEASPLSDIYSLGVVIIEITTGEENCRPNVDDKERTARKYIDKICEKWTEEHIASTYSSCDSDSLQQVKTCIKIGLECVEIDPTNRPSIDKIVDKLNERRTAN